MSLRAWLSIGSLVAITLLVAGIYWKGRSQGVALERAKTAAAQAEVVTARLEADLARQTAARVEVVVRRQAQSAEVIRRYSIDAENAEDADALLSPERASRLRNAERELCELAATLDGCTPAR